MIPFLAIMAENLILRQTVRDASSSVLPVQWWSLLVRQDFMKLLGYENFSSFQKAINKGNRYLHDPRYPRCGNFTQTEREIDGSCPLISS